jgi:hypothetical protein
MRVSEQALFQRFLPDLASCASLSASQFHAARCIAGCGTMALGAHVLGCPSGACEQLQFHACRHRLCPRCAESSRRRWIEQELQRLLPCPHFHVIFTLPHELLPLWASNRALCISLLFGAVRQSLLQLLANPRVLGATPGLLLSLHTWGRNLSAHPHIHALVSAGGIDPQDRWRSCRPNWLLPLRALQHLFRCKLLGELTLRLGLTLRVPSGSSHAHCLTVLRSLYRKHWNIEIRPPYSHGRGVVLYLARYAKGGPVPRSRCFDLHNNQLSFDYLDHRSGHTRTLRLAPSELLRRLLWHTPPRGVHTTRHAGLYASPLQQQHRLALAQLSAASCSSWPRPAPAPAPPPLACPHCSLPMLRLRRIPPLATIAQPAHRLGEFYPPSALAPPIHARSPPRRGPTWRSSRLVQASPGVASVDKSSSTLAPPGLA